MRIADLAAAAAVIVAVAACGDAAVSTSAAPAPTSTTAAPTSTAGAPAAGGEIVIYQEQTECCYIEGQISFARISGPDGMLLERGFTLLGLAQPLAKAQVPAGTYTVETWQQPCPGSCPALDAEGQPLGPLDGPADRCEGEVTLEPGETVRITSRFAPGQGCELVPGPSAAAATVPEALAFRRPAPSCGTDFSLADAAAEPEAATRPSPPRRCLLEAYEAGDAAELEAYEPNEHPEGIDRVYYLLGPDGVERIFTRGPEFAGWQHQRCAGLEPADPPAEFTLVGCGAPEPAG